MDESRISVGFFFKAGSFPTGDTLQNSEDFVCLRQMFNFVRKSAAKASPYRILFFYQTHPFSSSLESVQNSANQHSLSVDYLVKSCGFSPEKAVSALKYLKFGNPHRHQLVVEFLKNHGFTQTQIACAFRMYPRVILCNPQKTLLPKLEFLKSKGLSTTDVARITSMSQFILSRSLKNTIMPSFNFFENLFQSEERPLAFLRYNAGLRLCPNQNRVITNMKILRKAGVTTTKIMPWFLRAPGLFTVSCNRFSECVDEVEKLGFNPSQTSFMVAIHVLTGIRKSKWEKKVEVYKKWGLTRDEMLVAFGKNPWCMMVSEDKINGVMDFLVNEMGQESSLVARRPDIILLSLKKRIVPRSAVYQAMLLQGLINASDISLASMLSYSEQNFLKKVLSYKKEEAAELLKLYKGKLDPQK